jgi:hypothetical protein
MVSCVAGMMMHAYTLNADVPESQAAPRPVWGSCLVM